MDTAMKPILPAEHHPHSTSYLISSSEATSFDSNSCKKQYTTTAQQLTLYDIIAMNNNAAPITPNNNNIQEEEDMPPRMLPRKGTTMMMMNVEDGSDGRSLPFLPLSLERHNKKRPFRLQQKKSEDHFDCCPFQAPPVHMIDDDPPLLPEQSTAEPRQPKMRRGCRRNLFASSF